MIYAYNLYHITQNFGGVGIARKLAEKTLAVGRGKAHSILELQDFPTFWQIKLWQIGNEPSKFSPTKVLCYTVTAGPISSVLMHVNKHKESKINNFGKSFAQIKFTHVVKFNNTVHGRSLLSTICVLAMRILLPSLLRAPGIQR